MKPAVAIAMLSLAAFACQAKSPTAASAAGSTTTDFFTNGDVRLSYRLDLPARTGRVGAVADDDAADCVAVLRVVDRAAKRACRLFAIEQAGWLSLSQRVGAGEDIGE